jgi:hypothetical protein
MKRLVINPYEKIASQDLNDLQKAIHASIYDKVLYNFFQNTDGFVGTSFTATRTNASTVAIAAGRGFIYNSGVTDAYAPKYQAFESTVSFNVAFASPPSGGNYRRDIISIKSNEAVTSTASRYVKSGGTGTIALATVDKVSEQTYTTAVTVGVAAGSAGAAARPATPAGYVVLCEVLQDNTGVVLGGITDLRHILLPNFTNLPYADRFVDPAGSGTDTTLEAAVAALASGGRIIVLANTTVTTNLTIPSNITIEGKSVGITLTFAAGSALNVTGDNFRMQNIKLYTVQAALDKVVKLAGNYAVVSNCYVDLPAGGTNKAFYITGNANHVQNTVMLKTLAPATNTGIEFVAPGVDNTEQFNTYLS